MIRLIMFLLVPGLLLVAIACSDDDGDGGGDATPTATEIPAATPTPPSDVEPADANRFRQFADTLQAALSDGDSSFLRDRALTTPVVCTAANVAPGGANARASSVRVLARSRSQRRDARGRLAHALLQRLAAPIDHEWRRR